MKDLSLEELILPDEDLKAINRAIFKNHGIDFRHYEPKSLKRRMASAMRYFKLESARDLKDRLKEDETFIFKLMDELSVGLTTMFRDPKVWRKINQLLSGPYRHKDIKLWHAGCSTGEEVFTMGIVIRESGYQGELRAWATDISGQSIAFAKAGSFKRQKMDEYAKNYREYSRTGSFSNYSSLSGDDHQMDLTLAKHVKYDYHNLITDSIPETFDMILCRNVMIYFDSQTKKDLFSKFHKALNPGGLFVIGFYDASLPFIDQNYFVPLDADTRIFTKVG